MSLVEQIKDVLNGIDSTQSEGGWWETSTGAEFGAGKLSELLLLIDKLNLLHTEEVIELNLIIGQQRQVLVSKWGVVEVEAK